MTITRVWIEKGCVSCGTSENMCPEVFELKWVECDSVVVKEGVNYSPLEEKIKKAAEFCPVEVIKYEEAWESLHSETSCLFEKPSTGRIVVKVINHLGDKVMKVFGGS